MKCEQKWQLPLACSFKRMGNIRLQKTKGFTSELSLIPSSNYNFPSLITFPPPRQLFHTYSSLFKLLNTFAILILGWWLCFLVHQENDNNKENVTQLPPHLPSYMHLCSFTQPPLLVMFLVKTNPSICHQILAKRESSSNFLFPLYLITLFHI